MTFDAEYWKGKGGLEQKHYYQVMRWMEFFKPDKVLDFGCGRGAYVYAFRYYGVSAEGFEPSKAAVDTALTPVSSVKPSGVYDLVVCYDVFEHVPEAEVNDFLKELRGYAKEWLLVSVCAAGDPNFKLDSTHKTFKTMAWWKNEVSKAGFEVVETPKSFLFPEQLIVAKVKK